MRGRIFAAVAILAVLIAIVVVWKRSERFAGLDLYVYFVAVQLAGRADVENIYSSETHARIGEEFYARGQESDFDIWRYDSERRRNIDIVSSPFLYTCLGWLSRDYRIALRQYHALLLAAFAAGVLLLGRAARLAWPVSLLLLAVLLVTYWGFEADLRVGNVNSIQLAAVGASLVAPPFLAGAVIGLLIAFKPNLILIPILILFARVVRRDWQRLRLEIAGGAAGGVIAFAAASIFYGSPRVWIQWVSRAGEFYHRLPPRKYGNVTPALTLFETYGTWLSYALAATLVVVTCLAIWKSRRQDDVLIVGIAVLIYLMSALVVWPHYLVLPLVVVIGLLRWPVPAVVSIVALFLIAEKPLRFLGVDPPPDARFIAPAFAALFVAAIWKLVSSDSHPAPGT
ncbi:MAG TPA: glycosyltransferase 87 family protein [Thermoanaerobaculia bacterium]